MDKEYVPACAVCNSFPSEKEALMAIPKRNKKNGTYKIVKVNHRWWGECYEPYIQR